MENQSIISSPSGRVIMSNLLKFAITHLYQLDRLEGRSTFESWFVCHPFLGLPIITTMETLEGNNQAQALGMHWRDTPLTAVYCSDLKRAHSTAQGLVAPRIGTQSEMILVVNPLWREQNFGMAEGKKWAAEPSGTGDSSRFSLAVRPLFPNIVLRSRRIRHYL